MDTHKYVTNKFEHYIDILKKKAMKSPIYYKHSAILICKNKILSIGYNKYFKELMNGNKIFLLTIHAEIDVLFKTNMKWVRGLDILIIRIDKNLNLKNSRPCNACIDKLKEKGIRKVFYSNEEGEIVCEFIDNMDKLHVSSANKRRPK